MSIFFRALMIVTAICAAPTVYAAEVGDKLESIRAEYQFPDPLGGVSVPELVGRIIAQLLPLVGALFLVMFLWSGVLWMTAGGDSDKVKKAAKTMQNAAIGIAIVVGAYMIVSGLLALGTSIAPAGTVTT